ncbi:MAG TPA: glutamate--tRNA ligase [Clostridiales bacterium]|nr:glutamate--tRNA ligase [Clostridia bacterium]HCS73717.1 glutamate--tRNA ligase [Clostridiales bacterium]
MNEVRTRFAPSPTGYLHIGGLRTALYTYLIARKNNGKFLLRIEDTDQDRFVEGATDVIYDTLKLVGLQHDEGPDIGGPYGPYIQSERKPIYLKYAKELIKKDGAYYCFCTKDRLDKLRAEAVETKSDFGYDGHCRHLSLEEVEEKLKAGIPYVIRQKVPKAGTTSFHDELFGTITVENNTLEDGVLLKSDGMPTYNLANVVDDHLMKINPVVRGSEYLSSTPKYNLIYESFGWQIPQYIHLSPVMKEPGKKLSKRDGDASFDDFHKKGYLKDAILNYVALLGWSPGGDKEFFTLEELEQVFDIKGLSKSPAVFDVNKLRWMNGEYIKKLSLDEFHEMALPYYKEAKLPDGMNFMRISSLIQGRTGVLNEIPDMVAFLSVLPEYESDLFVHKKSKTNLENSYENLTKAIEVLNDVEDWNEETLHQVLFDLIARLGVKNSLVLWPIRIAASGKLVTPGGSIEILGLLGRDESMRRLQIGQDILTDALR